jgi:hypothetical protein
VWEPKVTVELFFVGDSGHRSSEPNNHSETAGAHASDRHLSKSSRKLRFRGLGSCKKLTFSTGGSVYETRCHQRKDLLWVISLATTEENGIGIVLSDIPDMDFLVTVVQYAVWLLNVINSSTEPKFGLATEMTQRRPLCIYIRLPILRGFTNPSPF